MSTATNCEKGLEIAVQVTDAYSEMNGRAKHNAKTPEDHKEIMYTAIEEAKRILDETYEDEFNN